MSTSNELALLTDVLQGDPEVEGREDYQSITGTDINLALKAILGNQNLSEKEKLYYIENSWRIHFRKKPPTISEFLTSDYLGPTAESLYPYIRENLIKFWDFGVPYQHAILASHIGWGKSFFAVLSNLFLSCHLIFMKDPRKYFGLSPATQLTQVLISFSLDKARDLLLDPFKDILESASFFVKCVKEDTLKKRNREDTNISKIYWTTAGSSALTFSNGVNIKLASSPTKLLGATILMGTMSELSFFQERGFSQDYIYKILTKLKTRIDTRFGDNFWARTILDSSPDDLENKVDNYIWNEAPKDKRNFIISGAEWDWKKTKYKNIDDRFPVFKGGESKPPKILSDPELKNYEKDQILWVPEEKRLFFEDDLLESLKDLGGVPAGSKDKLIDNKVKIEEMFVPNLRNIYTCIYAPYTKAPEGLIFNLIKDDFFYKISKDHYEFYRFPGAIRYISVDQAVSGDSAGFAMGHYELKENGDSVYVVDFSIVIEPNKSRINLDAIKFFISDLRKIGRLNIGHVSFDQFQSESTMQFLKRADFEVERLSVDISTSPYLSFIGAMNTNKIKMGCNIYMKNNLKSLILTTSKAGKKKVDHELGKLSSSQRDNGDWETSSLGFYAKDISDAVVASHALAMKYGAPSSNHIYKEEEEKAGKETTQEKFSRLETKLGKKEGLFLFPS